MSRLVWQDVAAQSRAVTDAAPFMLLQLVNANLESGYASVDFLADPSHAQLWDEAFGEFLGRSFRDFPLRKVCIGVLSDEFVPPSRLADVLRKAGSMRDHERRTAQSYVDLDLYEVWGDDLRKP